MSDKLDIMDLTLARQSPIIDYLALSASLREYANVRDKASRLVKDGSLIRVKKGLYLDPRALRNAPVSQELLANLIYGPSYVSLHYALSFYALIPERVEVVTSVTTQKNKVFENAIGIFKYTHLPLHAYSEGIELNTRSPAHFLIASREKALADVVAQEKRFLDTRMMRAFLVENLRIDPGDLENLSLRALKSVADRYNNPSVSLLAKTLQELK